MDANKFWARVRKSPACWEWMGGFSRRGRASYGQFYNHGRKERAHRAAWRLAFGPIPDGLWVLHSCDNPKCVNPSHLFLGDTYVNNADRHAKGRDAVGPRQDRSRFRRGEDHYRSILSDEQVREMREQYVEEGVSQQELANHYGISRSEVGYIVTGVFRKSAGGRLQLARGWRSRERHPMAKLREADVTVIRQLLSAKERVVNIAARFGVTVESIYNIKKGKVWK